MPTKMDVLRRLFLAYNQNVEAGKKSSLHSFCRAVSAEIADIWNKTKIPIISGKGIMRKLERLVDDYQARDKNKGKAKFQRFVDETKNLFDIARCKCIRIPNDCKCLTQNQKIPESEIDFLLDQRGERQRSIGEPIFAAPIVSEATSAVEDRSDAPSLSGPVQPTEDESEYRPSVDTESAESIPTPSRREHYSVRRKLTNFALECDRYNVHDRPAAALASAFAKDFALKDEEGCLRSQMMG